MRYKIISYTGILFFLLCINIPVQSQGVGLSGKRFSVFYNLDYRGPIMKLSTYKKEGNVYYNELENKERPFLKSVAKFKHSLQLEYTLRRNFSVGLSGSYYKDGFGVIEPSLFSKNYTSFSYGVNMKFFKLNKGSIAPLGPYINVRLFNTYNKIHYKGYSATFGDDYITNEYTQGALGLSLAWGKQGVLAGNVLFNLALEVGYLRLPERKSVGGDFSGLVNRKILEGSLIRSYLFNITFGVGICPF